MVAKRKSLDGIELPKYRYNPWMKELVNTTRIKKNIVAQDDPNKMMIIRDNRTEKEEIKTTGFYYRKEVDANAFVKVYASGVTEILGLTKAGSRVFVYLFDMISDVHNKDNSQVTLKYEHMAENDRYWNKQGKPMSRTTFFNGIRDLATHNIIAQSDIIGVYFINPMYIFNGDRLLIINEYKKKKLQAQLPVGEHLEDKMP